MPIRNWVGDLLVELPKHDPEYRHVPAGHLVSVYEYRWGYGLRPILDVKKMSLHFAAGDTTTADLTFTDDSTETWLVIGFRERA